MALPAALPIIGAGVNILGGLLGNSQASEDRANALALQKQALENITKISTPEMEQLKLALEKYSSVGQLNPEMQAVIDAEASRMEGIATDPRLKLAQMQSLEQLQKIGVEGLRPEDKAALSRIQGDVAGSEQARQESILQNMQQRGVAGSGAELASRLSSSQDAANREMQGGMDIGAMASQRALQAIMNAGTLGGQIQSQDFNQQAQTASAQDVINRYNSMNRQQVLGQNVASKNAAQAGNLQNAQNIANSNVDVSNKQQVANKQLPQQQFENELRKAQTASTASTGASNAVNANADRTANMWQGLGSGVSQGIAAVGANQLQEEKNIADNKFRNKYLQLLTPKPVPKP